MGDGLPDATTTILVSVLVLLILLATKSWLVDMCYPIIVKKDGWISVFGLYVFLGLIGAYLRPETGYAYGVVLAAIIRLLFLQFGAVLFARSLWFIAQLVLVSGFGLLVLQSYVVLPRSLPSDAAGPAVFFWVAMAGVVLLVVEGLGWFISGLRRGEFEDAINNNLSRLRDKTKEEDRRNAAELLLQILDYPSIGIEVSQLETHNPNVEVRRLLRLLEDYQQILCGIHSVLKHPSYPVEVHKQQVKRALLTQ